MIFNRKEHKDRKGRRHPTMGRFSKTVGFVRWRFYIQLMLIGR